jgi:NAD(P)H-nitrite reductase large subunit
MTGEAPRPEATRAHNRVLLSAVLAGDKLMPEITLRPPGGARHVQVLTREPVTWLDARHHRLRTASGPHSVNRSSIVAALASEASSCEQIAKRLKAGAGCGSRVPEIRKLLNAAKG